MPKVVKRRSGDSKYGFSSGTNGAPGHSEIKDGNESVDDLPLPPHPSETPPSASKPPNGVTSSNGGGKRYSSHFPASSGAAGRMD